MPLTEEQKIIEQEIQDAGYNHKFLSQLHTVKVGLNSRLTGLSDQKEFFEDQKITWSKKHKEEYFSTDVPKLEENGDISLDEDGNRILLTDAEIDDMVTIQFNDGVKDFDLQMEAVNKSISLIESEISFRNEGLVVRDPKGTTFYVSYDGSGADSTVHTTAWRWGYNFTNAGRSPGDVCIFRRVRGGFNPSENVYINNYCKRKLKTPTSDPNLDASFDDSRSPGFVDGTGQISAFGARNYLGEDTVVSGMISAQSIAHIDHGTYPTGANKNLSGTTTAYDANPTPVGNMSMPTNGVRLPRQWWTELIDPNSNDFETGNYYGNNNASNDSSTSYSSTTGNSDNDENLHYGYYFKSGRRITNPRDKSRWLHTNLREYDCHYNDDASANSRMVPQSSGTDDNPIMMIADYENKWGDFLDTGGTAIGSDGDTSQYKVDVGSKIIRRQNPSGEPVEVHSYITPGDWIFVGQLDPADDPPKVNSTYSDDPYEYSYCVRDVNYDKIVLWLPYKGEQAGISKRLVSMGYAPRLGSIAPYTGATHKGFHSDKAFNGSHMYFSNVHNWFIQGIEFQHGSQENVDGTWSRPWRSMVYLNGDSHTKFKDCNFIGSEHHANDHFWSINAVHWMQRMTHACLYANNDNNDVEYDKCIMVNTQHAVYEDGSGTTNDSGSHFWFRDVIFNGSVMDNNFTNNQVGSNHSSWDYYANSDSVHKWPEMAFYMKKASSTFDIQECEFVNWRRTFFNKQPKTQIKLRANRFLGLGLDFIDPTVDNDADAQENLGLRYSRACFAGVKGIHPDTAGWSYGMLYPAMDSKGNWSSQGTSAPASGEGYLKKIDIVNSSDVTKFGKFLGGSSLDNTGTVNKGSEWFVYSSVNDLTTSTASDGVDIGTSTSSFEVGKHARRARATDSTTDHDWRDNANANSGNAWGYSMQPDASSTNIDHSEIIASNDNQAQSWNSEKLGWNDNNMPWQDKMFHGNDATENGYTNWDQYKFYNGSLAFMGAKGFSVSGQLVWDWDRNWRSGDGGSTVMRASDGYLRFPYVYGGVRIPPSIPECVSRFLSWHNNFMSPMYEGNTTWHNQPQRHNHPLAWYYYYHQYLRQSHQNTTLAPALEDLKWNHTFDATYNEVSGDTVFDYKLSNGPGFGIGSAPHLGIMYSNDIQNSGSNLGNNTSYHKTFDQGNKTTSQDHYQMFLNYDFNQFKDSGHLVNTGSDFDFAIDRPLVTGVDGIGKGIIYEQGRFRQSDPFIDTEYGNASIASHINYGTNSANTHPNYRVYQYANVPLMETIVDSTLIESGGGNYLIKVFPTAQIGGGLTLPENFSSDPLFTNTMSDNFTRQWARQSALLIFEYPFFLSTNSRTYTAKLRPDFGDDSSRFKFGTNPTGKECWLEMEYWESTADIARLVQTRKVKKTNSETEFGTDDWKSLSLTVTPKTEGVGYLRLYWGKPREDNKVNTFYVDPKVVVY